MPLTLTVREGDAFYVEDDRVEVVAMQDDSHFVVRTKTGTFDIVDTRATEVLPNVRVSAGLRDSQVPGARAVINAPRSMLILTAKNYQRTKGAKDARTHAVA